MPNSPPSKTRHHNHRSSQSHRSSRRSGGCQVTVFELLLVVVGSAVMAPNDNVTDKLRKKLPNIRRSRDLSSEISTPTTSTKHTPWIHVLPAAVELGAGLGARDVISLLLCMLVKESLEGPIAWYFDRMNSAIPSPPDLYCCLRLGSYLPPNLALTLLLPPIVPKALTSCGFQASNLKDFTFEMCAPRERCTPAQSMQITVPWFTEAHSGSKAPQSAHSWLPGKRKRLSTVRVSCDPKRELPPPKIDPMVKPLPLLPPVLVDVLSCSQVGNQLPSSVDGCIEGDPLKFLPLG
mmetsp:Transcript_83407/g.131714  ORF Transcript_83407/g.131714 Transcript_83407/m.131714 type:complete len:292 (-) Transcript_83407:219-1094(-)